MRYAIDFGTSNSLLAAAHENAVFEPIALDPQASDPSILRSVLYFASKNEPHFGANAILQFVNNDLQGRLLRSFKKHLPSRFFSGTTIDGKTFKLEDLIAIFLREIKKRADTHFNVDCKSVVLGRPALYSANTEEEAIAVSRMKNAAQAAGFTEVHLLAEPIAAAYDYRRSLKEPKIVFIADFGGGTSDFSIVRMHPNHGKIDILALAGIPLAGDHLDGSLMRNPISHHFGADVQYTVPFGSNVITMPKLIIESICSPADIVLLTKRDIIEFIKNIRRTAIGQNDTEKIDQLFTLIEDQQGFSIFEAISKTKCALSETHEADFSFHSAGIDIDQHITRSTFEEGSQSITRRILSTLDETINQAGLSVQDIDLVCSTGGTARVPLLNQALISRFGKEKIHEHNRFHSIVQGLAHHAKELG